MPAGLRKRQPIGKFKLNAELECTRNTVLLVSSIKSTPPPPKHDGPIQYIDILHSDVFVVITSLFLPPTSQ